MPDLVYTELLSCPAANKLRSAWYAAYHRRKSLPASADEDDRRLAMASVQATEAAYTAHRHSCPICHGRFVKNIERMKEAAQNIQEAIKEA